MPRSFLVKVKKRRVKDNSRYKKFGSANFGSNMIPGNVYFPSFYLFFGYI